MSNFKIKENFILREKSIIYNKGEYKMRNLKNAFSKEKCYFTHIISEEEQLERYMIKLIDEVESVPEERVYYTPEEFWKRVEEREIKKYGYVL